MKRDITNLSPKLIRNINGDTTTRWCKTKALQDTLPLVRERVTLPNVYPDGYIKAMKAVRKEITDTINANMPDESQSMRHRRINNITDVNHHYNYRKFPHILSYRKFAPDFDVTFIDTSILTEAYLRLGCDEPYLYITKEQVNEVQIIQNRIPQRGDSLARETCISLAVLMIAQNSSATFTINLFNNEKGRNFTWERFEELLKQSHHIKSSLLTGSL